jgi:hypothetical protein
MAELKWKDAQAAREEAAKIAKAREHRRRVERGEVIDY